MNCHINDGHCVVDQAYNIWKSGILISPYYERSIHWVETVTASQKHLFYPGAQENGNLESETNVNALILTFQTLTIPWWCCISARLRRMNLLCIWEICKRSVTQMSSHTGASVALWKVCFTFIYETTHTAIVSYSFHLKNPLSMSPVHSKPSSNADLAVASSTVPVIFSF